MGKVLIPVSECRAVYGIATGGLGNVSGELAASLRDGGDEPVLVMPYYQQLRGKINPDDLIDCGEMVVHTNPESYAKVWKTLVPKSDIPVYLIEHNQSFGRDGLYGHGDDAKRFAFFDRAAVDLCYNLGKAWAGEPDKMPYEQSQAWVPDVIHWHDWMGGIGPGIQYAMANFSPQQMNDNPRAHSYLRDLAKILSRTGSIINIHNIRHQQICDGNIVRYAGLPGEMMTPGKYYEWYGQANLLKGAMQADAGELPKGFVVAVSPTYALNLAGQNPDHLDGEDRAFGLQGVLAQVHKEGRLYGITNGVGESWNPATDSTLPRLADPNDPHPEDYNYDESGLDNGKALCKKGLQEMLGLNVDPDALLIVSTGRLDTQKGYDAVLDEVRSLLRGNDKVQFVFHGTGQGDFAQTLKTNLEKLEKEFPGQVSIKASTNPAAFDPTLERQLIAAADAYLMPSRDEPCGSPQMYAQRYGTVPIVHDVDGLHDTVDETTGYRMASLDPATVRATLQRVDRDFFTRPDAFRKKQLAGMARDFSWDASTEEYRRVYEKAQTLAIEHTDAREGRMQTQHLEQNPQRRKNRGDLTVS